MRKDERGIRFFECISLATIDTAEKGPKRKKSTTREIRRIREKGRKTEKGREKGGKTERERERERKGADSN